jgi:hypothetical protein
MQTSIYSICCSNTTRVLESAIYVKFPARRRHLTYPPVVVTINSFTYLTQARRDVSYAVP